MEDKWFKLGMALLTAATSTAVWVGAGCRDAVNNKFMGVNEAAARASELAGEWMECWGTSAMDASAYQCVPGPGVPSPLVVCYQGACKLVRRRYEICYPPRKD